MDLAVCMHMYVCFQLVFVASPLLSFEAAKNFLLALSPTQQQQRWRRPLSYSLYIDCMYVCVLGLWLINAQFFNNFR